jgi:hypothetical protein
VPSFTNLDVKYEIFLRVVDSCVLLFTKKIHRKISVARNWVIPVRLDLHFHPLSSCAGNQFLEVLSGALDFSKFQILFLDRFYHSFCWVPLLNFKLIFLGCLSFLKYYKLCQIFVFDEPNFLSVLTMARVISFYALMI